MIGRWALVLMVLLGARSVCGEEVSHVRVMSFNIWMGGESGGQPLEQTAQAIRAAGADIVGLQETLGHEVQGVRPDRGEELAALLGWQYLHQGNGRAIMTRFKIVEATPARLGALLQIDEARRLLMFNVHLRHAPYQPYQLLGIPYDGGAFLKTADEAIDAAKAARGDQVVQLCREIAQARRQHADAAVLLSGDFNEPSHRDWVASAVEAGVCPMVVAFPATQFIEATGLVDAYRHHRPDVVKWPGFTWTPLTRRDDPKDRHDRIDFVFALVPDLPPQRAIVGAEVVGESRESADIVVTPWPSDHRAVVATIRLDDRPRQ